METRKTIFEKFMEGEEGNTYRKKTVLYNNILYKGCEYQSKKANDNVMYLLNNERIIAKRENIEGYIEYTLYDYSLGASNSQLFYKLLSNGVYANGYNIFHKELGNSLQDIIANEMAIKKTLQNLVKSSTIVKAVV